VIRRRRRIRSSRNDYYRAWIMTLPCMLRGRHKCIGHTEPCHVKTQGAGGEDVGNIVPLCRLGHHEQHTIGITSFQEKYHFNLLVEAQQLGARWEAAKTNLAPDFTTEG
jgi:hypothetical protein